VLVDAEPRAKRQLIAFLSEEKARQVLAKMSVLQIADFFSNLPHARASELMRLVPPARAARAEAIMSNADVPAATFMSEKFFAFTPETSPVSFGGPDNWAAATAMAAMIEGLAGVKDGPLSGTLSRPVLAPRWDLGEARSIRATVRYAASAGYVAYHFTHRPDSREIGLIVTGGGKQILCHVPLPPGAREPVSLEVDGKAMPPRMATVGHSAYVDFTLDNAHPSTVRVIY
jgi:hypothetical protein